MAGKAREHDPLPANQEAERVLLGYLLQGGTWPEEITVRDFVPEIHQILWRAMSAIHAAGEPIERTRVAVQLSEREVNHIGRGYLADLGEGCYPEMRIAPYVAKLKDATCKRDLLHHAHILTAHIHSNDRTAAELVAMGAEAFAGLGREQSPNGEPPLTVASWPERIAPAALYGLAGEVVRAIEPHTEADTAALLLQFLVGWGSLAGRGPYYMAEADFHHTNEYVCIVGATSKARKGTSWGRILVPLAQTDEAWAENCQIFGLGSGEALIDAVREDKRALVHESEFARLLAVIAREGSTMSSTLRTGWERGIVACRTRGKKKEQETGAHISLIGHITRDELLRRLSDTEVANGFGNRILWVCARRSKRLSRGGGSVGFGDLLERLRETTLWVRRQGNTQMNFDEAAGKLWDREYNELSEGRSGMLGEMTSRAEAHVVRLSLIYALLDCSEVIQEKHLRAALAVWDYCYRSARFIWGDALGNPVADEILRALKAAAEAGMTRWDIMNHFSRHKKAGELDQALGMLAERGLIRFASQDTAGRSVTRYWCL